MVAQMTGDPEMSLGGFKSIEWPDVMAVKLIYQDVQAITASGNEGGPYIYRLNSLFDPDETGTGNQPDGFDQLKALYGRYRVMACLVEVEVASLTSGNSGLAVMAPTDAVDSFTSEKLASLRNSVTAEYSFGGGIAKLRKLYRIGKLLGYSDQSVLANPNLDAAVTASPAFQQYLLIQNHDSSGTGQAQYTTRLTYYVRMEIPIAVVDAVSKLKFKKFQNITATTLSSGAACGGAKSTTPALLASAQLQKVRQMLDGL